MDLETKLQNVFCNKEDILDSHWDDTSVKIQHTIKINLYKDSKDLK